MKNIITIHIILCGLLSGSVMASEINSAIIQATGEAHKAISSQSNSPQGSPRKQDNIIRLSSGSLSIPIPQPKQFNSPSSSHSPSPEKVSNDKLARRASRKSLELLRNDAFFEEEEKESILSPKSNNEPFITITSKSNTSYKCLITHDTDDSDDDDKKEYVVNIQATNKSGKIYTIAQSTVPTNKDSYAEVFKINDNNIIVIDRNHHFYSWDGNLQYTPISYGENYTINRMESIKKKDTVHATNIEEQNNEKSEPENILAIITDEDNHVYHFNLVEYASDDEALSNPCIDIYFKNPNTGELTGIGTEKIPTDEKKYVSLLDIADKQTIVIDKDKNLYVWDGDSTYIPQSNFNENGVITIAFSSQSLPPSTPTDQPLPYYALPIAHITNINKREYLCYLSGDNNKIVDVYLLTDGQNTYSKPTFTITIPENTTGSPRLLKTDTNEWIPYARLLMIDNNQWVVIDRDSNLYIDNNGIYIQQSMQHSDHPEEALRNAVFIKPLPQKTPEIKSSEENPNSLVTNFRKINDLLLEQQKLAKEDSTPHTGNDASNVSTTNLNKQSTKNVNPDTDKISNRTPYIIGGLSLIAFLAAILYYHYDKLPNLTAIPSLMALFNHVSRRSLL